MNAQNGLAPENMPYTEALRKLEQLFPPLSEDEQRLALTIYRLLAQGGPASLPAIAKRAGLAEASIEEILKSWPGVYRQDDGQIIGFWGLTFKPISSHEMRVNGATVWAWCAWDTLFIPSLLGTAAISVRSVSPLGKRPISFDVLPNGTINRNAVDIYVSFLLPEDEDLRQDVITSFCHYVHFFADATEAERWVAAHPGSFFLDIDAAFDIGQRKNESQFGKPVV